MFPQPMPDSRMNKVTATGMVIARSVEVKISANKNSFQIYRAVRIAVAAIPPRAVRRPTRRKAPKWEQPSTKAASRISEGISRKILGSSRLRRHAGYHVNAIRPNGLSRRPTFRSMMENYSHVFSDPRAMHSFALTAQFVFSVVILEVIIGVVTTTTNKIT